MTETLGTATALQEEPVFFAASEESLFGIITNPPHAALDTAVILLGGGGGATPSTSTGRNRLHVRACRRLAALGYHTLRFDYHGRGESTGLVERFRLDEPFLDDLTGAVEVMKARGIGRYVVAGSCFGARTALAAIDKLDGLSGLVLLAPPLRDFGMSERKTRQWTLKDYLVCIVNPQQALGGRDKRRGLSYLRFLRLASVMVLKKVRKRIRRPAAELDVEWLSKRNVLAPLTALVARGVPVFLLYGTEDDSYEDLKEAQSGVLGKLIEEAGPLIELTIIPGRVHGFTRLQVQDDVVELVGDWVSRNAARPAAVS
jgi:pimeloyl-ACP methyl ester carboxylesterase